MSAAPDLFRIDGKVALLTGATRGIGLAIAQAMARAGATVVISSNEPEECERVAAEIRATGADAIAIPCDVANHEQIDSLVSSTLTARSHIDILVCNAGVAPHMGPLATASDADWDLTMTVNLRSQHWLTSLVAPRMAQRGGGSVIIVSSISSVRGNKAIGLYGLSKAASAQLARNLAVEYGPSNVRANAISPGLIRTQFAAPLLDNAAVLERRLSLTPLRRVGEPHEIAGVAVMLASPAGAFITGQNLIVDGGTTISDGN
ncbi:SDR family NAD(P)-dependent oxidoreductase [Steroidobacter sp.]|uniref:SDR family NAD(P)-dependent oxidoreductase n=1 Tax=Steroidobacter sp. TaxID=1978227 RepID=UPI001A542444|nr:glucose 1-dehydrogenase [Steroidobacter sp.]MBL8266038.1 glucose 1-dehydrogenase [Steroidobacter sp.]